MKWLTRQWYADQPPSCWLLPLERLFHILASRRKNRSLVRQWQAPVPVVIVGNISVGGTGKTPLVLYLCEQLKRAGWNPGIISRGYKSAAKSFPLTIHSDTEVRLAGDEPSLLARRSGCPVVIAPDRVAAAQQLLAEFNCNLIISDDGLQHYALGRDIEIAVLDGQRGLGNQHCLPAGPLREPATRLSQVDFLVVNGQPDKLAAELASRAYMMTLQPDRLCSVDGQQQQALDWFSGQPVHAVAGIGNPPRFFDLVREQLGAKPECHAFSDHHHYVDDDLRLAPDWPVLMTEKDAVKLQGFDIKDAWYVEVSACLPDNFIFQLLQRLEACLLNKSISNHG
ncbi:tetraacyldisaccharide 4'-kinase [Pontibacter sp. JAM-7]|uniref:tetraacyldisaccharide 4'-kinase n=1 Tax=Pontibacter sp. JAM-7 TaxID=3366581 RepID=UPI003AF42AC6